MGKDNIPKVERKVTGWASTYKTHITLINIVYVERVSTTNRKNTYNGKKNHDGNR